MTAVPTAVDPAAADPGTLDALAGLVADGNAVVLSGAGLSTDSGIPDYRGATGSLRRHTPMTYQTFLRDPRGRHRYWARSFVGWRQIADARPNPGHRAVAALQQAGAVGDVITPVSRPAACRSATARWPAFGRAPRICRQPTKLRAQ